MAVNRSEALASRRAHNPLSESPMASNRHRARVVRGACRRLADLSHLTWI
jgi:hypothetical protein